MLQNLKALIVVLALAGAVFAFAKPLCLRFMAPEDFARRRTVWLLLTVTAFLSPSFWLYVLVAVPLLLWAGKNDSNPVALFLLLIFVIPPMEIEIPIVGINRLFDLNNWRLLGLVVLLPAIMTRVGRQGEGERSRWSTMDVLLLSYGLLQLILLIPYESWTNTLRRALLFFLDTYLVFFAFSRLLDSRRAFTDALAVLCLMGAIFAPIAVFESFRGWLLYTDIGEMWGFANRHAWLFRGDALRAQAATGHSLTLGFIMAMSIGSWLYLRPYDVPQKWNIAVLTLLTAGLLVSHSRGPLLAAAILIVIFLALSSRSTAGFMKSLLVMLCLAAVFAVTPFGSAIVDTLPFIGTQGQETVAYRQQLAETSWALIQQNPLFGNPFVMLEMESLRQGQGIIDLVNAYAQVALFYGLVGLALFSGVFLVALVRAYVDLRRSRENDDLGALRLGAVLIACTVANLFFMATAGQTWPEWVLAGMLASYVRLHRASSATQTAAIAPPSRFADGRPAVPNFR